MLCCRCSILLDDIPLVPVSFVKHDACWNTVRCAMCSVRLWPSYLWAHAGLDSGKYQTWKEMRWTWPAPHFSPRVITGRVAERHGGHGWSLSPSGCAGCETNRAACGMRCEIRVTDSSRRRRCQACRCRCCCALDPGPRHCLLWARFQFNRDATQLWCSMPDPARCVCVCVHTSSSCCCYCSTYGYTIWYGLV